MFDIDLTVAKLLQGLAQLCALLLVLLVDSVLLYKSWAAIVYRLKGVDFIIQVLAVIGAIVVTFGVIIVSFWIIIFFYIRISGMSSIH
ncbi:hypothetical protein GF339_02965 [candidate division KSB3 bacterium]|uniref:Uncharacterized protein n=1 Tax=candidate division KSB3 bacterium TaxID=2044937 RepID=A0A9D5JTR5_9BACT|nr:hypothetical protein [candidate division KSB3 bacterium]